LAAAFQLLIGP